MWHHQNLRNRNLVRSHSDDDSDPTDSSAGEEENETSPRSSKFSKRIRINTTPSGTSSNVSDTKDYSGEGKDRGSQPSSNDQGRACRQPGMSTPTTAGNLDEFNKRATFYNARKVNKVWQNLAEDDRVCDMANKMDVVTMTDKFIVNRGSESYIVGNKRKRKLPDATGLDTGVDTGISELTDASDSSISSSGFSDDTRRYVKARVKKSEAKASSSGKDRHARTGQKIMEEKMAGLDDASLPFFMANKLREKKSYLFVRAMQVFGRELMMETFRKTMKIERLGGILIMTKRRRRTPGGVFLYLIRNNENLSKEDRYTVFEADRQEQLEAKRGNKRFQVKEMVTSMAAAAFGENNNDVDVVVNDMELVEQKEKFMDLDRETQETVEEEVENSYQIPQGKDLLFHSPSDDRVDQKDNTGVIPGRDLICYTSMYF